MNFEKPLPGSPEAVELGCKCPVDQNCNGLGRFSDADKWGYFVEMDCPIDRHSLEARNSFGNLITGWVSYSDT